MAFDLNKENQTVLVKKDCATCTHKPVCSFHKKMSELCKSNEFYAMNEYLEWNNSLQAFEKYASCQFYSYKYKAPKGEAVTIEADPEVVKSVLGGRIRSYGSDWIKKDIAGFDALNEEGKIITVERKVSEVLLETGYKFI